MANQATSTQPLAADLIPFIADPDINMLVVRLIRRDAGVMVDNAIEVETGPAWFSVLDVIAGKAFLRGENIAVPIRRIQDPQVRAKNARNQWNNLSLTVGSFLIIACPSSRIGEFCTARAAIQVKSPNGPEVDLVRSAYVIESQKSDPAKVIPLVAAALARPPDMLFMYALDLVGHRNALGRDKGADLLAKALAHPTIPADSKFEIGTHIVTQTNLFDPSRKADAANINVISGLATALLAEPDPERQLDWLRYLGSSMLGELAPRPRDADALRTELVRGVRTPNGRQMIDTLQKLRANAPTDQDRDTSTQLVDIWRRALGIS